MTEDREAGEQADRSKSRAGLVWEVLVFQAKLILDGFRDVILVPISLASALLGLVAGGNQPDKYFRRVLKLGRRSEVWINLFGHRKHGATSDMMIDPIRERVMSEAQSRPWLKKVGTEINRKLDDVNEKLELDTLTSKDVEHHHPTQPEGEKASDKPS